MEPTPPKSNRTKRSVNRPFYETSKKTSAEIISEARSTVKALQTRRPETPHDINNRCLFGSQREGRPPSAVSVSSSYDSRPPTGKARLSPLKIGSDFDDLESKLEEKFAISNKKSLDHNDKNNNNSNGKKEYIKINDNIIPKSAADPSFSSRVRRSKDLKKKLATSGINEERRVHSGPKERTPVFQESDMDDLKKSSSYSDLTTITTEEQTTKISRDSSKENVNNSKDYYTNNVDSLLKQMELNHLHDDVESLKINFDMLLKTLEIGNMLGKDSVLPKSQKTEFLSAVFKCVRNDNPLVKLKLSKLILAMNVTGRSLGAACKLIYQTSRDNKNDQFFLQEELLGPILQIFYIPDKLGSDTELVYLSATVRFLSKHQGCLQEMIRMNALKAISSLLRHIRDCITNGVQMKESSNILIQISSALSNFAEVTTLAEQFIGNGIIQMLLDTIKSRLQEEELVSNLSSILSKLTVSESICNNIARTESNCGLLMNAMVSHMKEQNTVVRLGYAFGNMANHSPVYRHQFVSSPDICKLMVKTVLHYLKNIKRARSSNENLNLRSTEEDEEVLIKLVRVIANLSITEEGAATFSDYDEWIKLLLAIIEINKTDINAELVINTAATVNNMSFFSHPDSALFRKTENFTSGFVEILLTDRDDCSVEVMRALGNFTQSENSRRVFIQQKGMDVILVLLDSSNLDLVFCTCGVLINLMVDFDSRGLLKKLDGVSKLVEILKIACETDFVLAALVCQIFWNYTEEMTSTGEYFNSLDADDLITVLTDYTDPSVALSAINNRPGDNDNEVDNDDDADLDEDAIENLKESWQDFLPIATSLLEKMEECSSDLEPLVTPPD